MVGRNARRDSARTRARARASEGFRVEGLGHGKTLQGPAASMSLLTGAL